MNIEQQGAHSYTVSVEGWGSPRLAAIHDGLLYFQAATCYPCPTCNGRVDQLDAGLARSGLGAGVDKTPLDSLLFFILPLPEGLSQDSAASEVIAYLSKAFDHPMRLLTDNKTGKPVRLPMKKRIYTPNADGAENVQWDSSEASDSLTISNEAKTLEWVSNIQAAWLPAQTKLRLGGSGKVSLDFRIEAIANAQIGVGFLLTPPDWGFFGYLGSSNTAWSYDAWEGAIVTDTQATHEGLPTIKNSGVVTLELNFDGGAPTATFIVDGKPTPSISLPAGSVVIPAGCLCARGQKVTLGNFVKS